MCDFVSMVFKPPPCSFPIPELSEVSVSEAEVYRALLALQKNKSPGPDGILPRILSEVAL